MAQVDFVCSFETVPQKKSALSLFQSCDETEKGNKDNDEYLMKLEAWTIDETNGKSQDAEFIVIVDRSGSMGGKPWEQVQQALIKILELTKNEANINVKTISYNHVAQFLQLSGDTNSDTKTINAIRSSGSTNFVDVFEKLSNMFKSKEIDPSKAYFIYFMTDGEDTCNNEKEIMKAKEKLQTDIELSGAAAVVHVLGFSDSHDEEFLESLTYLGTSDGTYSFVSPKEGEKALEERILSLIKSVSSFVGRNVSIEIIGENIEFIGNKVGETSTEIVLPAVFTKKDGQIKIDTKKFVRIKDENAPKFSLKLIDNSKSSESKVAGIKKIDIIVLEEDEETESHNLMKMRTQINQLMGDEDTANDEVKKKYEDLDKRFNGLKISSNISKQTARRQEAVKSGLSMLKEIYDPSVVSIAHYPS